LIRAIIFKENPFAGEAVVKYPYGSEAISATSKVNSLSAGRVIANEDFARNAGISQSCLPCCALKLHQRSVKVAALYLRDDELSRAQFN
jgi:hypothetical protein